MILIAPLLATSVLFHADTLSDMQAAVRAELAAESNFAPEGHGGDGDGQRGYTVNAYGRRSTDRATLDIDASKVTDEHKMARAWRDALSAVGSFGPEPAFSDLPLGSSARKAWSDAAGSLQTFDGTYL